MGTLEPRGCADPLRVCGGGGARRRASAPRSADHRRSGGDTRRARRPDPLGRQRSRPTELRRRGAPGDDGHAPRTRPRRARAAGRRARARHAGARGLPRFPGAERRPRRRPRAAPPGRGRQRAAPRGERRVLGAQRHDRQRLAARVGTRRARAGQVAPSRGCRPRRQRAARDGLGRRRHGGGGRGSREALRARCPEAAEDQRLFEALVAEARTYRDERRR